MGKPIRIQFPLLGQNKGMATANQPFATTFLMNNIRPYDTIDKRARGGQRPGLTDWGTGVIIGGANQPVVALCVVSSII